MSNTNEIKRIQASGLKPGMLIRRHGMTWKVTANTFDPHGNTGNQPRQCFTCDHVESEDSPYPGPGYATGCTFGALCDELIVVLEPRDHICLCGAPLPDGVTECELDTDVERARAAIAKAEGGASC